MAWIFYFLVGLIVLSIVIFFLLYKMDFFLKNKLKRSIADVYIEKLGSSITSEKSEKENLENLDILAKEFFSEIFNNLNKSSSYDEFVKEFKKTNDSEFLIFCEEIIKAHYYKENPDMGKIIELRDKLSELIHKKSNLINRLGDNSKSEVSKKPDK